MVGCHPADYVHPGSREGVADSQDRSVWGEVKASSSAIAMDHGIPVVRTAHDARNLVCLIPTLGRSHRGHPSDHSRVLRGYFHEVRVQRRTVVLAVSCPIPLCCGAGGSQLRLERCRRVSDLWLWHDPGTGAGRQDRVEDILVPQGWSLSRAHQGACSKGRTSRGRRYRDGTTRRTGRVTARDEATICPKRVEGLTHTDTIRDLGASGRRRRSIVIVLLVIGPANFRP